jgi:BMFP domain-containing protein YqiC
MHDIFVSVPALILYAFIAGVIFASIFHSYILAKVDAVGSEIHELKDRLLLSYSQENADLRAKVDAAEAKAKADVTAAVAKV